MAGSAPKRLRCAVYTRKSTEEGLEQAEAAPATQLRHTERTARLAYLSPDIIRAILDGRQPRTVTARRLARIGALPLSWSQQRNMLGFPAL